jgi:hypothetical protein
MALAYVSSGSDLEASSSSFTFDYGFSPTDGNILVATLSRNTGVDDIATPTGWTKLFSSIHGSAVSAVFYRVAGTSEPSFQVFTSSTSQKWAGGIVEYSGQDTTTPINQSASGTGLDAAPVSPTITPSVDNCEIIAGFGTNNQVTMTVEGTLTQRWNQQTTGGGAVGTAGGTLTQTTAAATGALTHTLGSSQDWFAYTIAIAPASGATTMTANSGSFLITGTDAITGAPKNSEGANLWFNSEWWPDPWWGSTWWTATSTFTLAADSGSVLITGTDATLSATGADVTLVVDIGSFTITGTDAKLSVPLVVDIGSFTITGTAVTFQIEFTSEEFIISNDTTFDGKGIIFGSDIVYNSATDLGYTAVSRVDVDSILLDGIYGAPPQPYQILEYVGSITVPSKTIIEFDGKKWRIVYTSPLGL